MKITCIALARGFESSSGKTPEWMAFSRTFRREMIAGLKARGCTRMEFSTGHFYMSGFFTAPGGQVWYFMTGDVRSNGPEGTILFRTAKDYKDYSGGRNHSMRFSPDMLERLELNPERV